MFRVLLPLLLLVSIATAQAPPETIAKIVEESQNNSRVQQILDHLVNRIGPRLTSSENLTVACEWARDQFASFGISSARLEEWGTFPVGFNRGPWRGTITAPESMPLVFTTPSWSAGTTGAVRGPVVVSPTTAAEFAARGGELKGAFVVRARASRPTATEPGAADDGAAPVAKPLERAEIERRLIEAGVLGVLSPAGRELVVTGGNHRVKFDALPVMPQIQVQGAQIQKIQEWIEAGQKVEAEFDIRNHFKKGPIPLYNVLAEIPGTEKPDELVIVGGHIDSWDGATGTTDNGTGTATTIEAARLLMAAGAKPRRTIRFMLWSGEEQGLLGSLAYIEKHPEENARVSAVLVHDGGTNYVSGIGLTDAMYEAVAPVLEPLVKLDPEMPFAIRKVRGLPFGIGSDHDSYVRAGVPGFFWGQSGTANYTHTHHTQYDTFDAANPKYQRHTAKVVAIGALAIANLPEMLSREGLRNANEVSRGGGGRRRTLGVDFADGEDLKITEIGDDSVAAKAGLKLNDKLIKIDGKPLKARFDVREALREGGNTKTITVLRDGKELEIPVTFPEAPRRADDGAPAGNTGGTPPAPAGEKK